MAAKLHDLGRINEDLATRIDDLVPRLFANAKRVGNYFELHDISGAPGDNLKIWRRGPKQGEWCDFARGTGGKPLGLVIASEYAGRGDAGEGIRWAARFLGHDATETPEQQAKREADAARQRAERERVEAQDQERKRRSAQALWLAATPIAGTLADRYLLGRAIDLRRLDRQPGALRFHPALKCPETGILRPAMIAAVAGVDGFMTVHRTFLAQLAGGDVVKADQAGMVDAKQSYSAFHGGVISIWRGDSGKALKDMPAGEWAGATEGIEDALSIAIAEPSMRVVCGVALGNLGKMYLPAQCGGIFWHRHRGDGATAVKQYERQLDLVRARGLALREAWAPEGAKDFNAWLQRQGDVVAACRVRLDAMGVAGGEDERAFAVGSGG